MAGFFLALGTVVLVLICLFLVLIVLLQRSSSGSGMGAAMGSGAAEAAFGASTGNVLTRGTIYGAIGFFVLAFALYLSYLSNYERTAEPISMLPEIEAIEQGKGLTAMPDDEQMQPAEQPASQEQALVSPLGNEASAD